MFNTNDLGFKVRSGKLKKHSEQLNKYTAGLLDSDGSISLKYKKMTTGLYGVYLQVAICQSESNDEGHELLHSLCKHYGVGAVYLGKDREFSKSEGAVWMICGKQAEKFLNVISKHLVIKAIHCDNLRWVVSELSSCTISNTEDLKDFVRCSRLSVRFRKHPKHLPKAWVAGYIDGDGHYRVRLKRVRLYSNGLTAITNEIKLFVGAQESDKFALEQLHKEYKGSLRLRKDGLWFWQLSLGSNSRAMALNFLKAMRKYSCISKKYKAICQAINFHEQATRRD